LPNSNLTERLDISLEAVRATINLYIETGKSFNGLLATLQDIAEDQRGVRHRRRITIGHDMLDYTLLHCSDNGEINFELFIEQLRVNVERCIRHMAADARAEAR
jgi:hypothetical protein